MRIWKMSTLVLLATIGGCDGDSTSTATSSSNNPFSSKQKAGGSEAAKAAKVDPGDTLANVNDLTVGSTEFEAAAARKVPKEGDVLSLEEKVEVLERLVDEKLLYLAALDQGLDKDPKVQKVMINTLLRQEVYANVRNSDFTDDVLQKYFDENQTDFVVPAKVQIMRILIKVKDDRSDEEAKSKAEELRDEVDDHPDRFKEIAGKHSEDPYRRRGGDVGFVPLSGKPGLDQAVVDMAFSLKPGDPAEELFGEVSAVFKSDEGYNIVVAANKRKRVERTFQQMKGSVLRKVKNEKLKKLYEDYVGALREGVKVETHEGLLESIEVKAARRPAGPGMGPGRMGGKHPGRPPAKLDKLKGK